MSNTADVTPYSEEPVYETSDASSNAAALDAERQAAREAERQAHQAATELYRGIKRRERLDMPRVSLNHTSAAGLLSAAQALGFKPVDGVGLRDCEFGRPIQMKNASGQRIELQKIADRVELAGNNRAHLVDVVRRSTLDSAHRHLEALGGGRVTVRQMANGDLELHASEKARHDGAAVVTARIDATGIARLDIENIRGTRCEEILAGFAKAVGGKVENKKLKSAYYSRSKSPGEPRRVRTRG